MFYSGFSVNSCQSEWNVPEEIPKACVSLPLPSTTLFLGHIPVPVTPHGEHALTCRWGDLKKRAWRWNPITKRHTTQGIFQSDSSPEAQPFFGCTRLVFIAGGLAWIWRLWAHAEGSRQSRSVGAGGTLANISLPAPRHSRLGSQAC